MSARQKGKQSGLSFLYQPTRNFEGNLRYVYTGEEMNQEALINYMEGFGRLKKITNPGSKWHVFMREKEFTVCADRFSMALVLDGWEEIGKMEL